MNIPTTQEFDAILASMPNDPANLAAYNQIMRLRNDSRVERQPFNFEVDFATVVHLTTAPVGSFLVDTSAPFMLVSQQYAPDVAAAAKTANSFPVINGTVLIQDQSSNRNWQSLAVPIPNIFGTGVAPYFLPQPRLIPANTTVLITVANYDAAQDWSVRLTFSGWRYYSVANN